MESLKSLIRNRINEFEIKSEKKIEFRLKMEIEKLDNKFNKIKKIKTKNF